MKILVLNGPNLNLLGTREPLVYGVGSLKQLIDALQVYALKNGVTVDHFQSNSEGELIDRLHTAIGDYEGIILNPGAYTHYSIALRDAISAINIPAVEVHISNIHKREPFRAISVISPVCAGHITGLGREGYRLALDYFIGSKLVLEEKHEN